MLLGCDSDSPLKELPQQLVLESYLPNGELISQKALASDDPVYRRMNSLLEAQDGGWKRSFASYRPAPFVLRGERIFIHCYADMILIDVVQLNQSTSMRKSVPNLLQVLGLPPTNG